MEKVFDMCKAALIKSVVEVAGEDSNEDVLWDESEEGKPGGNFVCKMVEWIKRYVTEMDAVVLGGDAQLESLNKRDDMVICASLALGNLARRGKAWFIERQTTCADSEFRENFNSPAVAATFSWSSAIICLLVISCC